MFAAIALALALFDPAGRVSVTALPKPAEQHVPLTVRSGVRDMIVVMGQSRTPAPAVLLIGGLGCYSLAGGGPPYGALLRDLERVGYVTARVEKTGEGASSGPPCSSEAADLTQEVEGYVAGLHALQRLPGVDPRRIFIFAHSLGPLEAARVAGAGKVRGVIAAETTGRNWFDYEIGINRSQPLLLGTPYDEVERWTRISERCLHRYYIDKISATALTAADPACRDILVPGVPDSYMHEVADVDLAADWKAVDVPVLVIYGGSDPATSTEDSQYLVDLINSFHPGRASYLFIPGMGHGLNLSPSKAQFMRDHGGPNPTPHPDLAPAVITWLRGHDLEL